jgi:hypothetical protein
LLVKLMQLRYSTIHHEVREMFGLTLSEYMVCDSIYQLSRNGPCEYSHQKIGNFLGIGRSTVTEAIQALEEKRLVMNMETSLGWHEAITFAKNGRNPTEISGDGRNPTKMVENRPHSINKYINNSSLPLKEKKEVVKLDSDGLPLESVPTQRKTSSVAEYEAVLRWAERSRGGGFRFVQRSGQYKALKQAKNDGVSIGKLKNKWAEMEESEFWVKAGFDWITVVNQLNKKA